MANSFKTTGVILAGGASSRFGSNKALALLNGRPLISHVASTLENIFGDLLLVTNVPETYAFLHWPMTGDLYSGGGPLAGIHAALQTISTEQACIIGCDMPFVQSGLIRYMCALPGNWDAAIPWHNRGPEPLCGVYRKSCLPVMEKHLNAGQKKIRIALEKFHLRKITEQEILEHAPDLNIFHNINRRVDLENIKEFAARTSTS